MKEDKEVNTLNLEKDRIIREIERMAQIKVDKEKMTEEALTLIQCGEAGKNRKI